MATNGAYHTPDAEIPVAALTIPAIEHALAMQRTPEAVLDEARRAADALIRMIEGKPEKDKCIINGEIYLQYEDWQTLGRFYGVSAAATSTRYVEYGDVTGFEASAEALLVQNGRTIKVSAAEAMCLDDEYKWMDKPKFQLRSMAQTRACAKALRNVLAWVVVLAGYRPTPAEEIEAATDAPPAIAEPRRRSATIDAIPAAPTAQAQQVVEPPRRRSSNLISDGQITRMYAIARDRGVAKPALHGWLQKCGFASVKEIPKDRYQALCDALMGAN